MTARTRPSSRTALALLLAAPAWAAGEPVPLWLPVDGGCMSSPFGPRPPIGMRPASHHNGVDIPAAAGTPVRAAAAGRVAFLRRVAGYGMMVELDHGAFRTRYGHLGRVAPALAEGKRALEAGAPLGVAGRSGISYGSHVHFEVRVDGRPVDPQPWLPGLRPCRPRTSD